MMAEFLERIGLGTVQFGVDYGITNHAGKPGNDEIKSILELAHTHHISLLDTAHLYGDSEKAIGRNAGPDFWEIVTKTPKVQALDPAQISSIIAQSTAQSLSDLKINQLHGLLLHDADDLLGPAQDITYKALLAQKEKGYAKKIGASVYTPHQLENILARYDIDLVQLPYNTLDQKFYTSGLLEKLKKRNIEVHARSAYLQGLLLQPSSALPAHLIGLEKPINQFHSYAKTLSLSPLQACLAAVLRHTEIDRVIIGINQLHNLEDMIFALKNMPKIIMPEAWDALAFHDDVLLNPAYWESLKKAS